MKIWILFCTFDSEGHPTTSMVTWWSSPPTTEQLERAGAPIDQEAALVSGVEVKDRDHIYWCLRLSSEGMAS